MYNVLTFVKVNILQCGHLNREQSRLFFTFFFSTAVQSETSLKTMNPTFFNNIESEKRCRVLSE